MRACERELECEGVFVRVCYLGFAIFALRSSIVLASKSSLSDFYPHFGAKCQIEIHKIKDKDRDWKQKE